jgi:hypothetical protein
VLARVCAAPKECGLLQGGALMAKAAAQQNKIEVPPPTIGIDFSTLLHDEDTADVTIELLPDEDSRKANDEEPASRTVCKAHMLVLKVRCASSVLLLFSVHAAPPLPAIICYVTPRVVSGTPKRRQRPHA